MLDLSACPRIRRTEGVEAKTEGLIDATDGLLRCNV